MKAFGSMPVFPALEGEREPGKLLPYESRALNPSALPHFSSKLLTSLDVIPESMFLRVTSTGRSEGLLKTVSLRVSAGTVSAQFSRGHRSSSKTW